MGSLLIHGIAPASMLDESLWTMCRGMQFPRRAGAAAAEEVVKEHGKIDGHGHHNSHTTADRDGSNVETNQLDCSYGDGRRAAACARSI